MRMLTPGGIEDVEVGSFRARSLIGSYWNEIQRFLTTGDASGLADFNRFRIRGRAFATDLDQIEQLARIGELDIEDIYEG
jgi:hypothetical protein